MSEIHPYDIFVSYADADGPWVKGYLLGALARAGVRCHSEAAFAPGLPRLQELERAIIQSWRTLLVLSPAYLADEFYQLTELLAQHHGRETGAWRVIPLTLRPVTLPPRLSMLTALDASKASEWPAIVERLCTTLKRPLPDPEPAPDCPYPGMAPFREQDARFFHGRDPELQHMLQFLRRQRALYVIGPSGCGKSSLVFAGLLPMLRTSPYFTPDFWLVRTMRPGDQPMHDLVHALESPQAGDGPALTGPGEASSTLDPMQVAGTRLNGTGEDSSTLDPRQVTALLAANPPAQRLLLVVDQFEELFTQCGQEERTRFLHTLKALQDQPSSATLILLRADFFGDLIQSDLWPIDASQRMEIGPLRGAPLRAAIEQPAADVGVHLELGLLERLHADAALEPGALPLMQETMRLLWGEMQRRFIPLSAYEHLTEDGRSGMAVAVATRADATLTEMPPSRRLMARRILLRMVQFGEGRADTRRQQTIAALRSAEDDPVEFERTLEKLNDDRLLIRGHDPRRGPVADLAHEVLIDGWPTFQGWLKTRSQAEQIRRRLEGKADEWVRLGRDAGGLLDATELAEAEQWLAGPDALELGRSADLLALVAASRVAINPGWHLPGIIAVMAGVLSIAALLGLLVLASARLPFILRSVVFLVPLVPVGVALSATLLQRRGDPYLVQKISHWVAGSRSAQVAIAGICVMVSMLWTVYGQNQVQTSRYCSAQGYQTGDFKSIAILEGNVGSFDAEVVRRTLSDYPELRAWVTSPVNLERCSDYFDYSLEPDRMSTGRPNEVSYSGLLKERGPDATPRRIALTPGPESCGMAVQLAIKVVDALHIPSSVEVVEVPMSAPQRCEPFVLNTEGFAEMDQKNYDEAERKFLQAIALDPSYAVAYGNLGALYNTTHRYQDAIKVLSRAVGLQSNPFAPFLIDLANAYSWQGNQGQNYRLAEENLVKAIGADPLALMAYANLSLLYREQSLYMKAQDVLNQAREKLPLVKNEASRIHYGYFLAKNQGILYFVQDRWMDAATELRKIDNAGASHEEQVVYYLASCYQKLNQTKVACGYWHRYRKFFSSPSGLVGEEKRWEEARKQMKDIGCL